MVDIPKGEKKTGVLDCVLEPVRSYFNVFFPDEVNEENNDKKDKKHVLVETNKGNLTLFSWLVVAIVAMWLHGAGDGSRTYQNAWAGGGNTPAPAAGAGNGGTSTVLSIAAALIGVAFSQIGKIVANTRETNQIVVLVIYCVTLPFIGGLVLGNTTSAGGSSDGIKIGVSVLAGLLLCVISGSMYLNRYSNGRYNDIDPPDDLIEAMRALADVEEEQSQYGEQEEDDRSKEEERKREEEERSKEEERKRSKEEERMRNKMLACISGVLCIFSLILAIVGTAHDDIEMDVRLGILGNGVTCGMLASVVCVILDQKANGGPIIEFFNVFLTLTIDVIPLGIELTKEDDKDNPNVMKIAAWVAFGSSIIFLILVVASLYFSYRKADATTKEFNEYLEGQKKLDPSAGQSSGTKPLTKDQYFTLYQYAQALDEKVDKLNEADAQKVWKQAKWELEQEERELQARVSAIDQRKQVVQDRIKELSGPVTGPALPQALSPAPVVGKQEETRPPPDMLFVPQGFYPEAGPDGAPLTNAPPRLVTTGIYPTRPIAGLVYQQLPSAGAQTPRSNGPGAGQQPQPGAFGQPPMQTMQGQGQPPMQTMQGQGQPPMQTMQGQGQPPMQTMQGQGQQPMQTMQGQGQPPMQTMQGQGQQPMQTMQGQGQSPMQTMQGQGQPPMPGSGPQPMQQMQGQGQQQMPGSGPQPMQQMQGPRPPTMRGLSQPPMQLPNNMSMM